MAGGKFDSSTEDCLNASIAQLVEARGLGPRGCRFDACYSHMNVEDYHVWYQEQLDLEYQRYLREIGNYT